MDLRTQRNAVNKNLCISISILGPANPHKDSASENRIQPRDAYRGKPEKRAAEVEVRTTRSFACAGAQESGGRIRYLSSVYHFSPIWD